MIRRLSAFLLVLACAFAPALPAAVDPVPAKAHDCCGASCCCDQANAPCLPPAQARTVTAAPGAVVVMRETASRPAPSAPRLLSLFVSSVPAAIVTSAPLDSLIAPAASVPLFKAHCSFRI